MQDFVTLVMNEVKTMMNQGVYILVLMVKAPFGWDQILSMSEQLAEQNFTLVQTLVSPSLRGKGNKWAFHIFIQAVHVWRWTPSQLQDRNFFKFHGAERDKNGKIVHNLRPAGWTPNTDAPGQFNPYAHQKPETHILSYGDGSLDPAAHEEAVQHSTAFFHRAVHSAHKWVTNFVRGSRAVEYNKWRGT